MYVHMHIQSYTVCSTADNSWVIALSFLAGPCGIYSGATRGIRIVNENRAFEHLCMVQAFNPSPSFSNAQIPSNPGNYDMRNSQYDMVWPETGLIRLLHCRTASNTHGKFFFLAYGVIILVWRQQTVGASRFLMVASWRKRPFRLLLVLD